MSSCCDKNIINIKLLVQPLLLGGVVLSECACLLCSVYTWVLLSTTATKSFNKKTAELIYVTIT